MANISSINGNPIVLGQGAKNTVTDDLLADTGIKQVLGTMAVRPKLRNGSCRNPGNTDAVCVAKVIPTDGVKAVIVGLDFEEIEGYSYTMSYMEYNTYEDVDPARPPSTDIITNKDPYKICESKYEVINLDSRTKAIAVWFYAVSDNDPSTRYPLRIADTGDAFVVYKSPQHIFIDELKKTLSVFMTREAFAYISDGGKFTFKDDTIFSTNGGRCGWRINSPSKIIVKLPKSGLHMFTMEQVLDVLGDENTVTESGVKWAYIAAGKGLVYNSSSDKLMLREISGVTPLDNDDYPLLLVWFSQMVGGMLYPRFLYDAANRLREHAANIFRDKFFSTSLVNSRHVPHRAGVTVASPLTLLHLSDIHGDSKALGRIMEDAARFSSLVNDSICTGDMVDGTATEIASWWNGSVLTCIGNHDTASYDQSTGYDWTALSMADRDSYYIEPFENNWNIVHTSGTSYYYKDYSGNGIRLIVMDCMLYMDARYATEANAQTAWLTSLLSDAIGKSLHVLIAIHAPHGGSEPIACSFSKYGEVTMPTHGDCDTPSVVVDAVASAISKGLTFIGYIVGHTHQDNIWDALNDHTQLMYCVTCAAVSYAPQWQNSDQSRSDTLDAYNLITIDTSNTLVKIVRGGGANIDNRMRQRKAISIDYSKGTIVGEAL